MILSAEPIWAQCPTGTSLWKAVEVSRNDDKKSLPDLLAEMLQLGKLAGRCGLPADSGLVSMHQRIAALYFNMDSIQPALTYINRSLAEYNSNPGQQSNLIKTRIFFTQAMIYKSIPDYFRARNAFDSLLRESDRHPNINVEFRPLAYKNMANISYQAGDYERALLEAEHSVIESVRIHDRVFECLGRIEKSMALSGLNRHDEALKEIELAESLVKPGDLGNDEMGNLYAVKASIERKLNRPLIALSEYNKCRQLYESARFTPGLLLSMNNIGDIYLNDLHDPDNALKYFRMALRQSISAYDSLRVYTNIADVFRYRSEFNTALKQYQVGLKLIFRNLSADPVNNPMISELSSTENLEYVFTAIANKAICWANLARLNQDAAMAAMESYLLADKMVDALSWETFMTGSRILWRSKAHELYDHAIALCYKTKNYNAAFYFLEKSRGIVLSQKLSEINMLRSESSNLLTELAVVRKKMNALNARASQSVSISLSGPDKLNYINLQEQYERIAQQVRRRHPYIFSTLVDTSAISLSTVQSVLGKDQKELLEVFVGNDSGYIMRISGREVAMTSFARSDYDKLVDRFTVLCSNQQLLNSNYAEFCEQSAALYRLLFNGIAPGTARLVISPDGRFFPYEALKRSVDTHASDYLVNDLAISYAYAARTLVHRNPDSKAKAGFLGIAPVRFNPNFRLAPLDESDKSLASISYGMGIKKILAGSAATKQQFEQNYYKFQCVQLYTHAAGFSNRSEPVIYFSDSALYLSDLIPEQQVATSLVVLSACETAIGTISKGEGIFSLNRGFAELGVPATVSTLWPVNNRSTYAITESFYKYLSKGMPKDVALQRAKLEFIHEAEGAAKLPFAWAAPVLIGDTSMMTFEDDHKKPIMITIIMIGIFLAFVLFFLQRGRTAR